MSRQPARHRRPKATMLRVGAALGIPTLVAAAIYTVAAAGGPGGARTAENPDKITFSPGDPTVAPIPTPSSTATPTPLPSTSLPTSTPTGTPTATPPQQSPSTPPEGPGDDESSPPVPQPTLTFSAPPGDPSPSRTPTSEPSPTDPPEDEPPATIANLLAHLQDLRADAGCSALSVDQSLMTAAQQHVDNPRHTNPRRLARNAGYDGKIDYFTFRSLLDNTPQVPSYHRDIVTDCDREDVGVGGDTGVLWSRWSVIVGND